MNRKLDDMDRDIIHEMLSEGKSHKEIAEAFRVSERTIDREAAKWKASQIVIRTKLLADGQVWQSVEIGEAVEDVDMDRLEESAREEAEWIRNLNINIDDFPGIDDVFPPESMEKIEKDLNEGLVQWA